MADASGHNGRLITKDSGTYLVRVDRIQLGLNIASNSDEARSRTSFYPSVSTTSSFVLTVVFPTWESREAFSSWLKGFIGDTIGGRGFDAAVRVICPSRGLVRTAIPSGPILYGETLTDVGYTVDVNFIGAADPLDINADTRAVRSYYLPPSKGNGTAKYYSPAGTQLSGAASLEGATYDTPAGKDLSSNPTINKPPVLPGGEQGEGR